VPHGGGEGGGGRLGAWQSDGGGRRPQCMSGGAGSRSCGGAAWDRGGGATDVWGLATMSGV
jgi:hypothetical protein